MKIMYCRKDFSSMTSTTILDKIDGIFIPPTSAPPPPNQGQKNGAFWILRGFILDLGRRVYSFQDCSPLSSRHHCLVFENRWENGAEKGT